MPNQKWKSPIYLCKIGIWVVGVIILGVGLHSHYESAWVKPDSKGHHAYKMCEFPIQGVSKCPKISMERYFVFMIILTFLLSTVGLVVAFVWEMNTKLLKFVDAGYHIIAAVLLLIAAIVYIASAEQILDILGAGNKHMPMRRNEKLAAGILTMLQSLLYGATALLIASKPCSHPY